VITTAAVPGRKSPILVTTAMVEAMGEGSLVIDMAATVWQLRVDQGRRVVEHHGVRVVGCRTAGRWGKREFHVREQRFEVARAVRGEGAIGARLERRSRDRVTSLVTARSITRDGRGTGPRARPIVPEAKESA